MSWTASDLVAIEAAIASGALSVQFSDRRVQYRTMDELLKARAIIKAQVESSTVSTSTRSTFASYSKD